MNLLNLCLRIPNLGILLYYLFFVVIIPYILIANHSMGILKYYMPLMVAFAHMLSLSGHKKLFGNLYELKPTNFVAFLSTNFINLFALFGILWQCIDYSQNKSSSLPRAVIYGIVLFVIVFPMARQGMKFMLDNVDYYMRKQNKMTFEYNWHLFVFGLLYIIFLLGLQAILLSLVDTGRTEDESDRIRKQLEKYKQNKNVLQKEKDKLMKKMDNNKKGLNKRDKDRLKENIADDTKINTIVDNIKKNIDNSGDKKNNSKNNSNMKETRKLLEEISMSNLAGFAKKQGINV
jgi:Skp family chaperone for outer membrane proteins